MTTLAPAPPAPTRRASAPRSSFVRHAGTLAWRGITKTIHSTEALLDVTLQPVIFLLLFVYVFGGAISGSPDAYLQLALPGVLVQTIVFASAGTGVGLAEDLSTGIFDRFRSLPISRSAPLVGAILADLVRYLTSGLIMLALGLLLGFRITTSPPAVVAAFGLVMVFAFAMCWVFTALAMVVGPAAVGAGPRGARDVAADVRQQRLRAHRHPAVVAARVRRDQPGDARGGRRPRAAQRRAGGRAGDVRAGRVGRGDRGVRPARGVPVPAPHLVPARLLADRGVCEGARVSGGTR